MKKRDACRTVRIHELELLFSTISMHFQRKGKKGKEKDEKEMSGRAKSKNAVNLIWCTSFFKTF